MRRTFQISVALLGILFAAMAFHAWIAEHDDKLRMQATISSQKQLIDAADARERDRSVVLKDTLAQIESLKHTVQTPSDILRELPKYLTLPEPITTTSSESKSDLVRKGSRIKEKQLVPSAGLPPATRPSEALSPDPANVSNQLLPDAPPAQIPAADLKPLYDYVQDCRSCQAKLAAAKQDSVDNAAMLSALKRERDAALTAAKGGTFWHRVRRNAQWFAIGVGAGAVALCGTGHCR